MTADAPTPASPSASALIAEQIACLKWNLEHDDVATGPTKRRWRRQLALLEADARRREMAA